MSILKFCFWKFAILWVVGALLFSSCQRDSYYEGKDIVLKFSADTLRFDTVFTSVGSATRWVKVYNPRPEPVLADFQLENLSGFFRINVDGTPGNRAEKVEIGANDSIYIFVEVTINPDLPLSVSPFIVEDRIQLLVNGNEQKIYLEAFGQNANYLPGPNIKGAVSLLSCNLGEYRFDDPKPYVIYGILYIDSCHVIVPEGTRIYVHGGVIRRDSLVYEEGMLIFLKDGRLSSEGTVERPVIFQGDRLEPAFQNQSGQWVGLVFTQGSSNHRLKYTTIKNSIIGMQVDSAADAYLEGCRIFNTSASGLIGRHADIYAENCLIYNNGANGIRLIYGGNYEFNYCTVGSFAGRQEALIATDFFCRDILCTGGARINPLRLTVKNSILTGNDKDEITLINRGPDRSFLQYSFQHCLVKVADLLKPDAFPQFLEECSGCLNLRGNERLFRDRNKDEYSLDSMSVAIGKALSIPQILIDIEGKSRKIANPDVGCYEL
ncbi:MAG: right-handed parallel beta-helix repeat-containing protein [Saprospiraceae bacterium]|nr:right-handed parallel beta-helix repeat-containing protein [Saprospiraceae bacterium]